MRNPELRSPILYSPRTERRLYKFSHVGKPINRYKRPTVRPPYVTTYNKNDGRCYTVILRNMFNHRQTINLLATSPVVNRTNQTKYSLNQNALKSENHGIRSNQNLRILTRGNENASYSKYITRTSKKHRDQNVPPPNYL